VWGVSKPLLAILRRVHTVTLDHQNLSERLAAQLIIFDQQYPEVLVELVNPFGTSPEDFFHNLLYFRQHVCDFCAYIPAQSLLYLKLINSRQSCPFM
jgi:hypothetical protein